MSSYNQIYRLAVLLLAVFGLMNCNAANATDKFLQSCAISSGDSVAKVKEYFEISEEPRPADRVGSPDYTYHLHNYGIWIFFDSKKLVRSLRFEAPFAGRIDGVSIGDSKEKVLRLRGEPAKRMEGTLDTTISSESRKKLKDEVIEKLPDPAPKQLVRKALSEIAAIDRLTQRRMEAWLYKSSDLGQLRYEFSPLTGKVGIIYSDHGTEKIADNIVSPVLEDRLRSAEVTKKRMRNGATLTEFKLAGSLQPNIDLDCISINEVKSDFNPPALVQAARKCVNQDQYSKAWALVTTANGFAYYDLKRLADRSTQGARTVLTVNAFSDLSEVQRDELEKVSKRIQADPEQVRAYCLELTKIGPPTYEPQWAILHGIGAYQEPRNGHYLLNVDTKTLWEEVLRNRCTPQELKRS